MEPKKLLSAILCILLAVELCGGIFSIVVNYLGIYNPTISLIFWLLLNGVRVGLFAFAALKSGIFSNPVAKCASFFLSAVYLLFFINQIVVYSDNRINMFSFMGASGAIILDLLWLVPIIIFLWGTRAWLPIKIAISAAYIFYFIPSIGWYKASQIYEQYSITGEFDLIEKADNIVHSFSTFNYVGMCLFVVSLILTIVWMNKRSIAPSTQNQPIDLI